MRSTRGSETWCEGVSRRSHLLSATAGGQILLWTSRLVAVTEHHCRPTSRPDLTRLADGRLVALLPRENDTTVVDLEKMSCVASFGDHTADVTAVAATNHSLVSASLDGSVRLWRLEQSGLASTDTALLALEVLHLTPDGASCHLATVSRRGHVTVWQMDWAGTEMPAAVYTVNILEKEKNPETVSVLLAAIGSVSVSVPEGRGAADSVSFTAGCLTGSVLLRLDVTVPLGGALATGGGSHSLLRQTVPADAPVLCLAVGRARSLLLGDSLGRVNVYDAEMKRHARYRCGAGSDPSVTHIICPSGEEVVITCDRNGMVCTLKQTDKLNILHASWEPALETSVGLTPPPAAGVQLDKDSPRPVITPPSARARPADRRGPAPGTPTAVLTGDGGPVVVGDSGGMIWCPPKMKQSSDSEHKSVKAHSAAVSWLGRDPARQDILFSCGRDRRLVVWRLRQTTVTDAPVPEQVGEFEFASSVRVCAALAAATPGAPSRLVCGDDRGRLHCLLVDLQQVPAAGVPPAAPEASDSSSESSSGLRLVARIRNEQRAKRWKEGVETKLTDTDMYRM
ncbi:Periodic tryptophan protein 2 [Amphibalanus amphitrite]|uniref:Periodic tryptophan protein 2 n=1 Tax=Amphibalanus amphitrite TaxID=1232801 RepID=A0A6A4VVK4_AMPAM|nr:Periodic tryptophan protein 2 [Amphibalanus amphitrite]